MTDWLLGQRVEPERVTLLVSLGDGEVGASVLTDGASSPGSLLAANELAHTQFPVTTDRCCCGQVGCLERVVSTAYYHRLGGDCPRLEEALARFDAVTPRSVEPIVELLSMAMANAVNLLRPHQLVLTGELARHEAFAAELSRRVRVRALAPLADCLDVMHWTPQAPILAQTAAWLALSRLFGLRPAHQRPDEMSISG